MKPRSLFDNPDAWVASEFKQPPRPRSIVTLPKTKPPPKPKGEKVVRPTVPFPPSERARPYQTGCSPIVRQTIRAVAAMADVPMDHLVSERRSADIVIVRQMAIWIARRFTNRSLTAIASEVGGRDHTTILHSIQRIDQLIADLGIEVEEDTPEAWTRALLAQYAAHESQRRADLAARQKVRKSESAKRRNAQRKRIRWGRGAGR